MIKVFQVIECGGPGGTGEQVSAICNGLDPARFDISMAYSVRGGSPEDYRKKCSGAKSAYYIPELTREISPLRDAAALRKLRDLFARHKPDVVHAHSSKAGVLARTAAKMAGVKKIFYSPHGYGFLMQDRSHATRALYRIIERGTSRIGATVAVSPSEAALARELAPKQKVYTISDAYLGDFSDRMPHDDIVIGSCGRMTHARNTEAWVLLVQRLTDSRNGIQCTWIGGGEDEPKARIHLTNMNLLSKVSITGWLPVEEAREKMRGLDIFVHYSRWDALPNAVLEAMALGLPVVASDIPGNRDVVIDGKTGFLVKNEVELLKRCQLLIDDEELRRTLGKFGQERVRREFSRERLISELSHLYAD
jgi:glycosyltransferase involved in cell wall biosynthesis